MIIDRLPIQKVYEFKEIEGALSSDEGVYLLLDTVEDGERKNRTLCHYYAYIAAADEDKGKYVTNLMYILNSYPLPLGHKLDIDLVELYICRHHDLDSFWLKPYEISWHAKKAAQNGYRWRNSGS